MGTSRSSGWVSQYSSNSRSSSCGVWKARGVNSVGTAVRGSVCQGMGHRQARGMAGGQCRTLC
eukprot:351705-Chlamydomonas_euryale.AAC.3